GQPAGGSGYPVLPPSAGDRGGYRSGSGGQESGGQPGPGTDAAAPVAAGQLAGSGGQGAGTGGAGTAGPGLGRPGKVSSSIRWSGAGSLDELVRVLPGGISSAGERLPTQLHIEQRSHSHDQYQPATDHPAQPGRSVAQLHELVDQPLPLDEGRSQHAADYPAGVHILSGQPGGEGEQDQTGQADFKGVGFHLDSSGQDIEQ